MSKKPRHPITDHFIAKHAIKDFRNILKRLDKIKNDDPLEYWKAIHKLKAIAEAISINDDDL